MTAFNATIIASADDAREDTPTTVITGTNITMDTASRYGGFRFQNVTIPQGATISAATLTGTIPAVFNDSPDVTIWCEAADNAAAFAATNNNISGRTATTATATWTATDIGTGAKTSVDFAAAVQEVINRAGWASGNALVVILKGNSVNPLRFNAYDGGGADYATLDVTYTAGGGGGGTITRVMHHLRQQGIS